jgi:hypothetical protein
MSDQPPVRDHSGGWAILRRALIDTREIHEWKAAT